MSSAAQGYWRLDDHSKRDPFSPEVVIEENWLSFYLPLWLFSGIVNSLYSCYWDVTLDWDWSCFTRIFKFSRPSLLSSLLCRQKWVYLWVLGSNLILRCTRTYKLSAHLRRNTLTVFTIAALEIFHQLQWAFFRVENEWNKMNSKSSIQALPVSIKERGRQLAHQ